MLKSCFNDILNILFYSVGFPPPELTWYMRPKNTGDNTRIQLNDNQRYDISKQIQTSVLRFGESWYTLRIKNVVANDFTEYWCVATNRIGSNDTTMIKLYRKCVYLHSFKFVKIST